MKGRSFHLEEIAPYLADGGDPEEITISMYQGDPKRWSMAGLEIDTEKERHLIDYKYIHERMKNYNEFDYNIQGSWYFKRGDSYVYQGKYRSGSQWP